jgi:hypothetical protein
VLVYFLDCWAAAEPLDAQSWSMLYGMQGMSSDVPEVRLFLSDFLDYQLEPL